MTQSQHVPHYREKKQRDVAGSRALVCSSVFRQKRKHDVKSLIFSTHATWSDGREDDGSKSPGLEKINKFSLSSLFYHETEPKGTRLQRTEAKRCKRMCRKVGGF